MEAPQGSVESLPRPERRGGALRSRRGRAAVRREMEGFLGGDGEEI
jgi:hypothetical protein